MNPVCAKFASGDFSSLVDAFGRAGFAVREPAAGVLQIMGGTDPDRMRLLVSVGVHGDETAPIEIVALLLEQLAREPAALQVDLMIVIGNIEAIAQGKRFIDVDLNRLFVANRVQFNDSKEASRADQLMDLSAEFFARHPRNWHLDLHTAIRASHYPTFAIVPGRYNASFVSWLGRAGILAAVLNPEGAVTYSAYTCHHLGATSCTAELGRIGVMGTNDLSQFTVTSEALHSLLRGELTDQAGLDATTHPLVFQVTQELIKRSDAFQLTFDGNTENFTRFAPHAVVATDNDLQYRVGDQPEYVLFPNQTVRVGLRAGLMVRRVDT